MVKGNLDTTRLKATRLEAAIKEPLNLADRRSGEHERRSDSATPRAPTAAPAPTPAAPTGVDAGSSNDSDKTSGNAQPPKS